MNRNQKNQICKVCSKIICKQCGWEANAGEVAQIQCGALTACPICGWKPENKTVNQEQRTENKM